MFRAVVVRQCTTRYFDLAASKFAPEIAERVGDGNAQKSVTPQFRRSGDMDLLFVDFMGQPVRS
jgi:hypothetical protein